MKQNIVLSSLVGALVLAASIAGAATYTENYSDLTATAPDFAGASTIGGGVFSDSFGPPDIALTNDGATDFPNSTDTKYLKWLGTTDQYGTLAVPALAGTEDTVQIAFPIRVDSLDATLANNTIDIVLIAQGADSVFGLTVASGVFRMASSNTFGAAVTLSTTAFDNASPQKWADGTWRILAGRVTPKTDGSGSAKWWSVDPVTGAATVLADVGGLTNARASTGLTLIGYGASLDVPAGTANCGISVDNMSFYSNAAYPNESAFLTGVRVDYANGAAVTGWSLY
jgi:hypothetical protein